MLIQQDCYYQQSNEHWLDCHLALYILSLLSKDRKYSCSNQQEIHFVLSEKTWMKQLPSPVLSYICMFFHTDPYCNQKTQAVTFYWKHNKICKISDKNEVSPPQYNFVYTMHVLIYQIPWSRDLHTPYSFVINDSILWQSWNNRILFLINSLDCRWIFLT